MASQQKETIEIPSYYTEEEATAIALEVLDRIIERTKKENLDRNNRKFTPYSKSYSESLDFNIAGKSKNSVDLTMTGDMLSSLKVLKVRKGAIEIGYEKGDPINGKVEGNRLGTYGNQKPVTKPRDFLGIHKDDLRKIYENYPRGKKNAEERLSRVEDVFNADVVSQEIIDRIIFRK